MPSKTKEERRDLITRAQNHLLEAINLLEEAELGPSTKAYVIDRLEILASEDHGFVTQDTNLDDVLRELDEGDEDEDEE